MKDALPIPTAVETDSQSMEVLRVWVARGGQHVSLSTDVWKDPAAWGIMLVDLMKHVASAYQQNTGQSDADVLKRIRAGFDAEWQHATDEPSGELQQ